MNSIVHHNDANNRFESTATIHNAVKQISKVLVKADRFIHQYNKAKNWKHLSDTFNHDDFYMQKPANTSRKLIVRSDFECRTKQLHTI